MFSHIFGTFPVFSNNSKETHQSFGLIKRVPQQKVTPNAYSDLFQTCARLPEIARYHSGRIVSGQIVCRRDIDDHDRSTIIGYDDNQRTPVNRNSQKNHRKYNNRRF